MKRLVYLMAMAGALGGCQKNNVEPNEDTAVLHARFHGQYKLVSSTADQAIDLNRDGQASTDVTKEIPDLTLRQTRLIVLIRDGGWNNGLKWFEEWWPQPIIIRNYNYSSPDSMMLSGYLSNPMPRDFTVDKTFTSLLVEPGPADKANGGRTAAPESVTVLRNDQLKVVTLRLLYISRSWHFVRITTIYQRFTSIT
jgi:hypothetical protein